MPNNKSVAKQKSKDTYKRAPIYFVTMNHKTLTPSPKPSVAQLQVIMIFYLNPLSKNKFLSNEKHSIFL